MKKSTSLYALAAVFTSFIVVSSCEQAQDGPRLILPEKNYEYFADNDEAKIGRVLFYDKSLSHDNKLSCASCHIQSRAFADDKRFSLGIENQEGRRNTPTIQNIELSNQKLFWDGRENQLNEMVLQPIFDHTEMGIATTQELVNRVAKKDYYKDFFEDVYHDGVTLENIGSSLAAFVTSMRSTGSRFEIAQQTFTELERKGMELFNGDYNCNGCHNLNSTRGYYGSGGFSSAGDEFEPESQSMSNVGLDPVYKDKGEGEVFPDEPRAEGRFKVPNLRNIELTAPYMHDGRFETLDEVVDHYSENVVSHPNLDSRLKDENGEPIKFNIPDDDKEALIAFMKTLTDHSFISDPKYSNPFQDY